ncbi:exodeoxyribonuclease V subunit gamma [Tessaracoccus sp. OS52]|uniref:exodeoxyribonuclease V subunit gamma n=1 Tax=Tessaracoccus sp. OS52 TaxID=2886691 RepID=UPI001D10578F|nr:exodeoxyribonuclease V subunit gamma [Tessaracoccus sp. OS52]
MSVLRRERWKDLVSSLASSLSVSPPGPFAMVEVLVSSHGAGRMLGQALSTQLPGGITAGIAWLTVPEWIRRVASEQGLAADLETWHSVRASVVAADALLELGEEHPILAAHLNSSGSAARRQQLAQRCMQLLRRYAEQAPGMVSGWLEGADVDASGRELPAHLAWQPALLRLVTEELQVDPVDLWSALEHAAADRPREAPVVFAVPQPPAAHRSILAAAGGAGELRIFQVCGGGFPDWTEALADEVVAPATPRVPSTVEVHGSHGPNRQVEVLRDELTRRFAADPTLEPRDVLVVCEDPASWRPHLVSAFSPSEEDPLSHPGRRLRLEAGSVLPPNLVVEVIRRCLRLSESRATASEVTELLLLSPVAHRWRLGAHRQELLELVSSSGIRWGLDQHHRSQLQVPGVSQNTWLRGVDRLLTGLAVAPGSSAPLAVTGVATVGTSDLELVGTLGELLSRLRRFNHSASTPATAVVWVDRVRQLLTEVVGCAFEDEWMALQANAALSDLAEQLADVPAVLERGEFARLFESLTREFAPRPTVGNGALQVVATGDLAQVDFRLVCLLGLADHHGSADVDAVDLGEAVLDSRQLRLARLVAHARAADEVLVVTQTRDPLTDRPVARATTVAWLLRELGFPDQGTIEHPLLAHSEPNFTAGRSFDQQALGAAKALRLAATRAEAAHVIRRRDALGLPHGPQHVEVGIRDLASFLKDPAKDFLRSAAGVRMYESARLSDALPFVLDGLEEWGIKDRLLESFKSGAHPDEAAVREVERELLPPGHVGRRLLEVPLELTKALWRQAWNDWSGDPADHRVELRLGDAVLADTIRTRGGRIVEVTASQGRSTELKPWLEQLALAASGIPAEAVIHRPLRNYSTWLPETAVLPVPDPDTARTVLLAVARAWSQGRTRFIPLPQEPALELARELAAGEHKRKDWEIPSSDWKRTKWSRMGHQWRLFYSDVPAELFDDPATSRDPEPPEGAQLDSAFAAWTAAIYLPMLQGGR